jgi:hypothetical protein
MRADVRLGTDRSGSHTLLNPGFRKTLRILDVFIGGGGRIDIRLGFWIRKLLIFNEFQRIEVIRPGLVSGVGRLLSMPATRLVRMRGKAR